MAESASNSANEPGAAQPQLPQEQTDSKTSDKESELEQMRKLLAAKDAELAAMKEKLKEFEKESSSANTAAATEGSTTEEPDAKDNTIDDGESKQPDISDIVLSVKGVAEFDEYPFFLSADRFYFMASVKAPYFRSDKRAPIDLVAVVDESGSMAGERLKLVKETVQFIIKNLESSDRLGIIGYSNGSRQVLALTNMDASGRKIASKHADDLSARGGTALCAGLVAAVNMMRNRKGGNDVASVMLLTDGQANHGPTSAIDIKRAVLKGTVPGGSTGLRPNTQHYTRHDPETLFFAHLKHQRQQVQGAPHMHPTARQRRARQLRKKHGPVALVPRTWPFAVASSITEEEEGNTETGVASVPVSNELACTINTFGFGTDHNEALLEALAENGRGMYAFIEKASMIADTFAECIGGLVSIIAQDLKVTVEALKDVEINKCLSTGDGLRVVKHRKVHQVSISNMQSEENRDLIFDLKLPKLAEKRMDEPLVRFTVDYKNVLKDVQDTLSNVCTVDRSGELQAGKRNMQLDVQYNRVLAADAMEEADQLAAKGKMDDARKVLSKAQATIKISRSRDNKFSNALVTDIETVSNSMRTRQEYSTYGGKMLKMNKKAHRMQRSVQSTAFTSQKVYMNTSKCAWKSRAPKTSGLLSLPRSPPRSTTDIQIVSDRLRTRREYRKSKTFKRNKDVLDL